MNPVYLDAGIYTNIFPVLLPSEPVCVMTAQRRDFANLRPLKATIQATGLTVSVYAAGSLIYGYGPDMQKLASEGFVEDQILLVQHPQLATHLVIGGIVGEAVARGYEAQLVKGRPTLLDNKARGEAANGKVRVYIGYDLRCIYRQQSSDFTFGLVVDVTWALRNDIGQPLSMSRIAEYGAAVQVAQIQGEYLPYGCRINTEVARQRLQEQILPFVQAYSEFALPCGGTARLLPVPIRVILEGCGS